MLALAALAYAEDVQVTESPVYGYIQNHAIPLAEKIREAEEQMTSERIIGGNPSQLGAFPYQAGLLAQYAGLDGTGVCGGSLVSSNKVITAAHCWFDGRNQAWIFTVVLGSITLFSGGTRVQSSAVAMHPNWIPLLVRNDVAVIYLPNTVASSDIISPIALPSGSQLSDDFVGVTAVASGFGWNIEGGPISANQFLSHVSLNVISNSVCRFAFPLNLHASNICTSSLGGASVCRGDSGGPLAINSDGKPILIGITSYGSGIGCAVGMPAAFARVTSFMDFFRQHIVL
uniref:Serine protease 53 n=1 Tax=Mamestra configurata TaxID=174822 RepID=E7D005_9NEOP|nr:serine protease 53 [Mamestra configurata]